MNISQDSAQMISLADQIDAAATSFKSSTQMIVDAMNNRIGAEAGGSYFWYGPNAGQFLNDFNNKCPDQFDTAYKNIKSMADNLRSQAEAWDSFENSL